MTEDHALPPEAPTPPESVPANIVDELTTTADADQLHAIATYAQDLANWQETTANSEPDTESDREIDDAPDGWNPDEWQEVLRETADAAEIPAGKGTVTVKTINGNDYYYLQWREGETVTSKYLGPTNPSEE